MSTETADLPGEEKERGWRERISEVAEAGESLLATRLAILREELSVKGILLSKGLVAVAAAFALGVGALLLFAALLAAVLAALLKSVAFGIFGALLLYAAGTAVFVRLGWSALARVRPFDYPATREELSRDWEAVREAARCSGEAPEGEAGQAEEGAESVEDLEERFRSGFQ